VFARRTRVAELGSTISGSSGEVKWIQGLASFGQTRRDARWSWFSSCSGQRLQPAISRWRDVSPGAWSDGSEGAERKFMALFLVICGLAAIASNRATFGW